MRVRDCVNREPLTIREDATLRDLHAIFRRYEVPVIPVVGRDSAGRMRRLLGVVARADLLKVLLEAKTVRALESRLSRGVGSIVRDVGALRPADSLAAAVERISEAGIPALPVVDGGRLLGIVSVADLLASHAIDGLRAGWRPSPP